MKVDLQGTQYDAMDTEANLDGSGCCVECRGILKPAFRKTAMIGEDGQGVHC